MNHGSLFSGIGGFDLASQWCGWKNVFQVEKDKFCTKVLRKNFPNAIQFDDIYNFKGEYFNGTIDIISGGFPCQPFSVAGKQKGEEDDRYLWPEMARVIEEIRPTWVVAENVAGIISMALDQVLSDLETIGYEVQVFIIPACAVNAPHRRDRIWIVAYSNSNSKPNGTINDKEIFVADSKCKRLERKWGPARNKTVLSCESLQNKQSTTWAIEPDVGRVANGIPNRTHRLKALGNAIVPQVAYEIFKGIDEIERNRQI